MWVFSCLVGENSHGLLGGMFVQMKIKEILLFILLVVGLVACNRVSQDTVLTPLLEVYEITLKEEGNSNAKYISNLDSFIYGCEMNYENSLNVLDINDENNISNLNVGASFSPHDADTIIIEDIVINKYKNLLRRVGLYARRLPESSDNLRNYEAFIIVTCEDGYITQQILDLSVSHRLNCEAPWDIEIDQENPFNFHFADYNSNGYLDMGLRASPGGSLMNDPHYIWTWDIELMQFMQNPELELISWGGSIQLIEEGYIISSFRIAPGHYVLLKYSYIDDDLVLIHSEETINKRNN